MYFARSLAASFSCGSAPGDTTTTAEVWRRAAVIRATWSPEELEQRRNGRGLEALAERFGKGPEFERLAREVLGRQT